MPGIIDTHSHIAIQGGVNEGTLSIVPEVRVADVVDGDDAHIYEALAGGTTSARLLHGSANTIGGQDVVVKLRFGQAARDLIIRDPKRPQGVKFALGENVTRSTGRFPNTRMGVEATIERAFLEGRAYAEARAKHEAAVAKGEVVPPFRRDLRLEALARIRGRLDQDPQPLLSQRRDPHAPEDLREVRGPRAVAPARPGRLQGRGRDRRARGQRLHLLRLVGLQDRGLRRHPLQRRPADRGRRPRVHQERLRGADPPPLPRSRQDGQVRRRERGPGARIHHPEPRPGAGP